MAAERAIPLGTSTTLHQVLAPINRPEALMRNLGSSVTVFLLFFGFALLDAIVSRNLIAVCLFLALGLACLRADGAEKR